MPHNSLGKFSVRKGQLYETGSNQPWSSKELNSHIRRTKERVETNERAGIDSLGSRQLINTLNSALRAKEKYRSLPLKGEFRR